MKKKIIFFPYAGQSGWGECLQLNRFSRLRPVHPSGLSGPSIAESGPVMFSRPDRPINIRKKKGDFFPPDIEF